MINYQDLVNQIDQQIDFLQNDSFWLSKERKSNHNHVDQTELFIRSEYFQNKDNNSFLISDDLDQTKNNFLDRFNDYNSSFINKSVKGDYLYEFPKMFYSLIKTKHHFKIPSKFFFKKRFDKENIVNTVLFLDNPKKHKPVNFQYCLGAFWSLIYLNLPEYSIFVLDKLNEDLKEYEITGKSKFKFLTNHPHTYRAKQSLDWAYAWFHRQAGQQDQFLKRLNSIVLRHPLYNNQVEWFVGRIRLIEASALKYNYNQTDENLNQLYSLIKFEIDKKCIQFEEHLEEALLVFNFCCIVLKKYPYKYE